MHRRNASTALAALALACSCGLATAQAWPSKPITLIVPFPAGGSSDALARTLGTPLSQALGQPVIVESRPGAGATIGADYVAKAKPDGYTLLMGAVHHTIATSVYRKLPYDFEKSFAPITTVALVPNVVVVNARSPAMDVKGLVAQARSAPDKLSFGSNGNGTLQHLIGTQFASLAGAELVHVPYKGSAPLTTDLLGGHIHVSFDPLTPLVPHIQAGKLRALAVTTAKRSSTLPDVPTLAEAGMAGMNEGTWFGIMAPAVTPAEIVAQLNTEMVKITQLPEFGKRMAEIGAEPVDDTQAQMAALIKSDTAKYARLVKQAKVAVE